ncbi:MAG: hypothetical protein IH960_11240 [Chloroflexi bacterium]|nr:hypothetical protein [Chloroflexota bacterium]
MTEQNQNGTYKVHPASREILPDDPRAIGVSMLRSAQTGRFSDMESQRQRFLDNEETEWINMDVTALSAAAFTGRKKDLEYFMNLEIGGRTGVHRSGSTRATDHLKNSLTAALSGDAERSAELLPGLLDLPHDYSFAGLWPDTLGLSGMLSKVLGKLDDAVEYLSESLSHSRDRRHPPAIAMNCEALAGVLLERDGPGDHEKAVELQDEAIAIATDLGMKPVLERVLSQREILKA